MILSFRHKGLKRLFEKEDTRRLPHPDVPKIERILARLDEATEVDHMRLPGFRLHPLKGDRKGFWSVTVRANWRIIFRFDDGHAHDVDYLNYH